LNKTMDDLKRQAASAALDSVKDGMIVGLGTGSTASHFIRELGARVKGGLRVHGIPTSEESNRLAVDVGIPLITLRENAAIDVTVDGADEVSDGLDLIKGLGGALVREKVVAHASKKVIIVVDETKLTARLGQRVPVPVEVIPFAVDVVRAQLVLWGGEAKLREKEGKPFVSDNGNLILDWWHGPIDQPWALEKQVKGVTGVVDSGIFANVASEVIAATAGGIRRLARKA
jgi:ribose 5-phosphate isomerase A